MNIFHFFKKNFEKSLDRNCRGITFATPITIEGRREEEIEGKLWCNSERI
jgi:hypothetical protein